MFFFVVEFSVIPPVRYALSVADNDDDADEDDDNDER
jgi:hypothetical protein